LNESPANNTSRETRRLLVLALVVAGMVALLHFTPLKAFVSDLQGWKTRIDEFGWIAHVAFFLTSIAAIALGAPRLMLAVVAGTLFGFVEGFALALISGVVGSYIAFLVAQRGSPVRYRAGLQRFDSVRKLLEKPSVLNIFFVRQLPVPALALNLLLGLVKTPHRIFLLGTFLGQLPSTGIVASMGSAVGKQDVGMALKQVSWGMAGLAVVTLIIILIRRKIGTNGPE